MKNIEGIIGKNREYRIICKLATEEIRRVVWKISYSSLNPVRNVTPFLSMYGDVWDADIIPLTKKDIEDYFAES